MPVTPPFAHYADIEGIWRPLSDTERVIAANLIEDASLMILEVPAVAARVAADLITGDTLRSVTKFMVQRVLLNPERLRQFSMTVDDATKSGTYGSVPVTSGDLLITDTEMDRLLGRSGVSVSSSGAFTIRTGRAAGDDLPIEAPDLWLSSP